MWKVFSANIWTLENNYAFEIQSAHFKCIIISTSLSIEWSAYVMEHSSFPCVRLHMWAVTTWLIGSGCRLGWLVGSGSVWPCGDCGRGIDNNSIQCTSFYLQCFNTVGWVSGRASGLLKLSDGVLVWLSVWSVMQMICIWSSWCHYHPSSLVSVKSRMVYLSGAGLPRLPWKKGH